MIVLGSILINHAFTALVTILFVLFFWFLKVLSTNQINKKVILSIIGGFLISLVFYIPSNIRHSGFFEFPVRESHGSLEVILQFFYQIYSNHAFLFFLTLSLIVIFFLFLLFSQKLSGELNIPAYLKFSSLGLIYALLLGLMFLPSKPLINLPGSVSREYNLADFLFPPEPNYINNPIGWGLIIFVLVIIGIFYMFKKDIFTKNFNVLFTLNFFLILLIMLNGIRGMLILMPFRMWTLSSLFVALIAGYGFYKITNFKDPWIKKATIIIIVLLVLLTSFSYKYDLNTNDWGEYRIRVPSSYPIYDFMKEELKNEKVINLCRDSTPLFSYDLKPPIPNLEVREDKWYQTKYTKPLYKKVYDLSEEQLISELKSLNVNYVVLGETCLVDKEYHRQNFVELKNLVNQSNSFEYVKGNDFEYVYRFIS